jgi:hypothetical protein
MPTTTAKRPPLGLPKRCPVTVTHLCANNDVNGNPRRVYVVTDHEGAFVEALDEGYEGEAAVYNRWPYFQHRAAERLGVERRYVQRYDVEPAEYRRQLRREPWEGTERLRRMGDRYARNFDGFGERRA